MRLDISLHVTLPDGAQRQGTSWETSPMDIALQISKGLADRIVIAKVNFVSDARCDRRSHDLAGQW